MGDSTLIYRKKFESALHETEIHVQRMDAACSVLHTSYDFPVTSEDFHRLVQKDEHLAFADQMIYRFSKAQVTIQVPWIPDFPILLRPRFEGSTCNRHGERVTCRQAVFPNG